MTAPLPTPDQELDQAVIDAGRKLAALHLAGANLDEIAAARAELVAAREARYPDD